MAEAITEEKKTEEKPLSEMTEEEVSEVRKGIAAEEFEDNPPAGAEVTPEIIPEKEALAILETQKKEEKPELKPEEQKEDKKWAGVNLALRETLEALTAKVAPLDTLSIRLKQTESRLGAIQNEFYAAKKAAEDTPKAPTAEEMAKAAAKKEEWDALKTEYPDWAVAMDRRFLEMTETQQAKDDQFTQGFTKVREQIESGFAGVNKTLEKRLISFRHPGWETTINTPEYQEWIAKQPNELRQKTFSLIADDAITVLDAFSSRNGSAKETETEAEIAAAKRKERLEQSVLAEGTKATPPKSEADMTDADYRRKCAKETWG
ncbi:MAG: hypothetical protein KAV87_35865 [Desulfobacteraceae bacterium]|nr:hypothetical protein [Desulfobacteraceae bacterium]